MKALFSTDYHVSDEDKEKAQILLNIFVNESNNDKKNFTPKRMVSSNKSEAFINDLHLEGYIEKPNLYVEPLKLTKEGEKLLGEGGYIVMKINKFEKEKDEVEFKNLNLEIKKKQLEQLEYSAQIQASDLHKVLTTEEFENLLKMPESSILDFKREMYDFTNDSSGKVTAGFVKDIISLSNTIRTETAYIIIGVVENEDGSKALLGLDKTIDDATFQEKVKNKVYPIPNFSFYKISYNQKIFGVISIPVVKYDSPISSTVKAFGLDVGKYYHRQGSSNQEVIGVKIFHIYEWLKLLPTMITDNLEKEPLTDQISVLLKRATNDKEKLSSLITDILYVAKKKNLIDLVDFCSYELKGVTQKDIDSSETLFNYRFQQVVCSRGKASLNPFLWTNLDSSHLIHELREKGIYFEYKMLFHFSITDIESHIAESANDKAASLINKRIKDLYPKWDRPNDEITIYLFNHSFVQLYKKIRQKTIDLLLEVS